MSAPAKETVGDVAGRIIIVTGGGGGIGRGLVRDLASRGADVVVAEINPETMAAAVKEVEGRGGTALGVRTDIGDRAAIFDMVDQTVRRFGRVDGIVNNAHIPPALAPLAEVTEEDIEIGLRGHVKATLWGMQAVYPHMRAQGWGRIVNVASSAGLYGFKGYGGTAPGFEGARALTRVAAREWAGDGIVVNCYCPVSVLHYYAATANFDEPQDFDPHGFNGAALGALEAMLPVGTPQTVGDAEHDLGPTVAFLLSDACRYLTGQTLTLDGGAWAHA